MANAKKLIFVLFVFVYLFRIWQTTGCGQFASFVFNPLIIKINVESAVSQDAEMNRNLSRFFHNKVTTGLFEISKSYIATFEPRFLLETLGPVGLLLTLVAAVAIFKNKNLVGLAHLLLVLLTSAIALAAINSRTSFYILALSRFSFSFWGLDYALRKPRLLIILVFLAIFTLWYYSFSWQMPTICNKIFFN